MLERNKIYNGDARVLLKQLDDNSIDCCITSPPYWSLRDYGIPATVWDDNPECEHQWDNERIRKINKSHVANEGNEKFHGGKIKPEDLVGKESSQGQYCQKCGTWLGCLGLEPSFDLFIKHLADIYDEVMRILKPTGTCFVNLGDSYGSGKGDDAKYNNGVLKAKKGVKGYQKCLLLIPQRFAIEMVNRGWILRNVIIWHKPNCMPSSAKDRFTVDFEYVYFFVKRKKYAFTQQKEEAKSTFIYSRNSAKGGVQEKNNPRVNWGKTREELKELGAKKVKFGKAEKYYFEQQREPILQTKVNLERRKYKVGRVDQGKYSKKENKDNTKPLAFSKYWSNGRAKRCVWTIPTKPNPEAHFATFPPKLVEPMILSGCPEFVCKKCGKPREKIIEYNYINQKDTSHEKYGENAPMGCNKSYGKGTPNHKIKGWTDCGCNAGFESGIVLDPFAGTGTTCKTAFNLGRDYIGFEISTEYKRIYDKIMKPTKNRRISEFV